MDATKAIVLKLPKHVLDGNRTEVIKKYKDWLFSQPQLLNEIKKELKGKILGCWCSPLPCHGDVLSEIANQESIDEFFN